MPSPLQARALLLTGLALAALAVMLWLPPIPQDPAYHAFADRRALLGLPNALNVLSNLPFAVVGAVGLAFAARRDILRPEGPLTDAWERTAAGLLFTGVLLTGAGSAYYHLWPDTRTLFWDRLPMTIVFMTLFTFVIGDRVSLAAGRRALPLLLAAGAGSVLYWRWSELRGAGDLRLYALAQFFPLVAIPFMLLWFPPRYTRGRDLGAAIGWYGLAKLFELFDGAIYAAGGLVSGHSLKHLAAALAAYWVLRGLRARRLTVPPG
jgi:hypothetical protein